MRKLLMPVFCVVVVIAMLGSLGFVIYKEANRYNPDNYIGLTAEQIIDRYGEFDRCSFWDSTGNYRHGTYVVVQEYAGFFEIHYEEIFIIRFDENGVAYECEYKDMNKEPGL